MHAWNKFSSNNQRASILYVTLKENDKQKYFKLNWTCWYSIPVSFYQLNKFLYVFYYPLKKTFKPNAKQSRGYEIYTNKQAWQLSKRKHIAICSSLQVFDLQWDTFFNMQSTLRYQEKHVIATKPSLISWFADIYDI